MPFVHPLHNTRATIRQHIQERRGHDLPSSQRQLTLGHDTLAARRSKTPLCSLGYGFAPRRTQTTTQRTALARPRPSLRSARTPAPRHGADCCPRVEVWLFTGRPPTVTHRSLAPAALPLVACSGGPTVVSSAIPIQSHAAAASAAAAGSLPRSVLPSAAVLDSQHSPQRQSLLPEPKHLVGSRRSHTEKT